MPRTNRRNRLHTKSEISCCLLVAACVPLALGQFACSEPPQSRDDVDAGRDAGGREDAAACAPSLRDHCGDCNGGDARLKTYYVDADGDGLGDADAPVAFCDDRPPSGHAALAGDCDDGLFACGDDCSRCHAKLRLRPGTKLTAASPNLAGVDFKTAAMANVGDINGDGVIDLMVGARILFLSASGQVLGTRGITGADVPGTAVGETLGASVAALGDVDRDGIPDVALAEPRFPIDGGRRSSFGRTWVMLLGRSGAPRMAQQHVIAPTSTECGSPESFISRVAGVDVDGDGARELMVTSSSDCIAHRWETGRIDLTFLAANGAAVRTKSLGADGAPYTRVQFRNAFIAGLGGASLRAKRPTALAVSVQGAAWVIGLRETGDPTTMVRVTGQALAVSEGRWDERAFLTELALGDDQTNLMTSLLGAPRGGLSVFRLAHDGIVQPVATLAGPDDGLGAALADGDGFGAAFATLGDLDGDGLDELAVLAHGDDTAAPDGGAVYVMHFEGECAPGSNGAPSPYGDCNGSLRDGCETRLVETDHCGACGFSCANRPHATGGACNPGGRCELVCERGYADCDGNAENGCELSSAGFPNSESVTCRDRTVVLGCKSPYGDCDGDPSNGCEADLSRDAAHCGGCGRACGADPVTHHASTGCVSGACVYSPTDCAGGWSRCSATALAEGTGACDTCGSCDQERLGFPPPRACNPAEQCKRVERYVMFSYALRGAVCEPTCPLGRGDCDGNPANGCEADLTTEAACGSCGANCGIWDYRTYCVLNAEGARYACEI